MCGPPSIFFFTFLPFTSPIEYAAGRSVPSPLPCLGLSSLVHAGLQQNPLPRGTVEPRTVDIVIHRNALSAFRPEAWCRLVCLLGPFLLENWLVQGGTGAFYHRSELPLPEPWSSLGHHGPQGRVRLPVSHLGTTLMGWTIVPGCSCVQWIHRPQEQWQPGQ